MGGSGSRSLMSQDVTGARSHLKARLDYARVCFQIRRLTRSLAEVLGDLCTGLPECPQDMAGGFPQRDTDSDGVTVPFDTVSEDSCLYFRHVLLNRRESPGAIHMQGKRNAGLPFKSVVVTSKPPLWPSGSFPILGQDHPVYTSLWGHRFSFLLHKSQAAEWHGHIVSLGF